MPRVTIKSGDRMPDGREEVLSEYICDWPGCPNVATHPLGVVSDIGLSAWVCDEHRRHRRDREDAREPE